MACSSALTQPSIAFKVNPDKNHIEGRDVGVGICGHAFHVDCAKKWLTNKDTCSICCKPWEFVKCERIAGFEDAFGMDIHSIK